MFFIFVARMRALKFILIVLVAVTAALGLWLLALSPNYTVVRTITLEQPESHVYPIIDNTSSAQYWLIDRKQDSTLQIDVSSPATGTGAWVQLRKGDNVISRMEITSSVPNELVVMTQMICSPLYKDCSNEWKLTREGDKTIVQWSRFGKLPFQLRWMNMEERFGNEMSEKLNKLQMYCAQQTVAPDIDAEIINVKDTLWLLSTRTPANTQSTDTILAQLYGQLLDFAKKRQIIFNDTPVVINHKWNTDTIDIEVGFYVRDSMEVPLPFTIKKGFKGETVHSTHVGPYNELQFKHKLLRDWIKYMKKEQAGSSRELYIVNAKKEPNSAHWKTEIFYPIKEPTE